MSKLTEDLKEYWDEAYTKKDYALGMKLFGEIIGYGTLVGFGYTIAIFLKIPPHHIIRGFLEFNKGYGNMNNEERKAVRALMVPIRFLFTDATAIADINTIADVDVEAIQELMDVENWVGRIRKYGDIVMDHSDPLMDKLSKWTGESISQMQAELAQSTYVASASNYMENDQQNNFAFWVGIVAAFFGFFGISHIINGKIGSGIVWLLVGFVWNPIFLILAATGIGLFISLPLHIAFCYYNAKGGARNSEYTYPHCQDHRSMKLSS